MTAQRNHAATASSSASQPTTAAQAPTAGAITVRVRYCECDPMGVAHHASYGPWLEMGRTELLRETGVTYAQLELRGVFLVITRLDTRYRRGVKYDDLIEIRTRVVGGSRVKIRHEYELVLIEPGDGDANRLSDHNKVCATAMTELACIAQTPTGPQVRTLPDWLVPLATE